MPEWVWFIVGGVTVGGVIIIALLWSLSANLEEFMK